MPISLNCACGRKLRLRDESAGKRGRCPTCGRMLDIPGPASPESEPPVLSGHEMEPGAGAQSYPSSMPMGYSGDIFKAAENTRPEDFPQTQLVGASQTSNRSAMGSIDDSPIMRFRYIAFVLVLIPLMFSYFSKDDVEKRLAETLKAAPNIEKEIEEKEIRSFDAILEILPEGKIQGALLSRHTWAHWIFGAISGVFFLAAILSLFPIGNANRGDLLIRGAMTGTFGILFLIVAQYIAMFSEGIQIRGFGYITLFILLAKFIGFSYAAATDPENGFWLSFFGFTFGVGLCEEVCKAFPLISHFRGNARLNWQAACVWGLASGAGFGISEGIMYSSDYYNGLQGSGIYLVRFVSCVGLHAIWCGAAAISIYRDRHTFRGWDHWTDAIIPVVLALGAPMILHGLYDTLLKREMEGYAILVALFSFAWLIWQIESINHEEGGIDKLPAGPQDYDGILRGRG